jgi:hypothetical protein
VLGGRTPLGRRERRLARILDSTIEHEDLEGTLRAEDDLAVGTGNPYGFRRLDAGHRIMG